MSQELEALIEEARRRARRRRLGYAAGLLALIAAVAGLLQLRAGPDGQGGPAGESGPSAALTERSELLYARGLADGREGVFEIDAATGDVRRLRVPLSCGDTPSCLISSGGKLVISSVGRTGVYDPSASRPARAARIGSGWITVPSATDGRVWLGILDRGRRGGPYSRGLGAVREVTLNGRAIRGMRPPGGRWPAAAVANGLLFQDARSLRLWSFAERGFTLRIPGPFATAASGSLVASCSERCPRTVLTDTRTGEIRRVPPPEGYRWLGGAEGTFSPDRSHLALPVRRLGEAGRSWRAHGLAVIDVEAGAARTIAGSTAVEPNYRAMAWAPAGDRLFFVSAAGSVMSHRVGSSRSTPHARFGPDDKLMQLVSVRRPH